MKRVEINDDFLDNVSGGAIGFDVEDSGTTYTMKCEFTGEVHKGIPLSDVMRIGQFAATVPNNLEGEKAILQFARDNHII